jgi:hypothetical protein
MPGLVVRAERAWSAVPFAVKAVAVAAVLVALVLMSAVPAFAEEAKPFRWR